MTRILRTLALAGGLSMALAPAAQAAIKNVSMGIPSKSAKQFNDMGVDVNDYFPHRTTLRVGDSIRFVPAGFHTAELTAKGSAPDPLIVPNGAKVSGANDAAGLPFWFNGQDQVGFNPALLSMGYGKKFAYNGSKRVSSGLPLAEKLKPMTVRFTKAGSYKAFCNIHPGMEAVVKVNRRRRAAPTVRRHKKAVSQQVARDFKIAKQLVSQAIPANTVSVGVAGRYGVEWFALAPTKLTVPVGSTLNFAFPSQSFEVHTATAGPGDPEKDPNSYLGKIATSFQGAPVFDPLGVYPSTAPGAPSTLTPTTHGNGFWNTGVMDSVAATPAPDRAAVRFDGAGVYNFWCLIHPNMRTEITVQ
jgi:plastocyanin